MTACGCGGPLCGEASRALAAATNATAQALATLDVLEHDLHQITAAGPVNVDRLAIELVRRGWRKS